MGWRVLGTARAFWASGRESVDRLQQSGCAVEKVERLGGPLSGDTLVRALQGFDAVIAGSDAYTADVFAACPQLKVVSRCGIGTDAVDIDAATRAGVLVTNTPGAMTDAVADYAFGLMLALARRIVQGDAIVRGGGWLEAPGIQVWGKTLGLVGLGKIGRAVAHRAAGFSMRILAFDPQPGNLSDLEAAGARVELVSLEELLRQSDVVSVHAPSTPETRGLINAARLALMKPSAILLNTARGALIDDGDLARALKDGVIAGAAIDVFVQEPPPPDHPLRDAPNCLLTPHNAFNTVEAAAEMSRLCVENVLAALGGRRPPWLCNPEVIQSPALRVPIA